MINFFKDSVRELKHVVWPTRAETNKHFIVVVVMLVLFWIYLFLASILFTESLFWLKWILNTSEPSIIPAEVENVLDTHSQSTWIIEDSSITVEEDTDLWESITIGDENAVVESEADMESVDIITD